MSTSFIVRLHKALQDFRLQEAETLSDAIHEAEGQGYEVSKSEDRLWQQLTEMILRERRKFDEQSALAQE